MKVTLLLTFLLLALQKVLTSNRIFGWKQTNVGCTTCPLIMLKIAGVMRIGL